MSASSEVESRQERERRFYEQFSEKKWSTRSINFDPILSKEERPWNSYWFLYGQIRNHFRHPSQRLLDLGCGAGATAILSAKLGYEAWAVDISPNNIAISRRNSELYGVENRAHFSVGSAESLEFPSNFFDVVAGIDILHHITISEAIKEVDRVLKPGGIAVFREPASAPVFDRLRHTQLGRWIVSDAASLEKHITEDEHKLTREELSLIFQTFRGREYRFNLLARVSRWVPKHKTTLERVDRTIITRIPFVAPFAGAVVLVLEKR